MMATIVVFFLAGRWQASNICGLSAEEKSAGYNKADFAILPSFPSESDRIPVQDESKSAQDNISLEMGFTRQRQAKKEFQSFVLRQQVSPADCSRILHLPLPYDAVNARSISTWVESLEVLAKALQIALSTERRLMPIVVDAAGRRMDEMVSQFCQHSDHELYCRWMNRSIKPCRSNEDASGKNSYLSPLRRGLIPDHNNIGASYGSNFFHSAFYGPEPVVQIPHFSREVWPMTWFLDSGLAWERLWGSHWVRAQLLDFLWIELVENTTNRNRAKAEEPRSGTRRSTKEPRRVLLVWDTRAHEQLQHRFARNATKTHGWKRLEKILHRIEIEESIEVKQRNQSFKDNDSWEWELSILELGQKEHLNGQATEALTASYAQSNSAQKVTLRQLSKFETEQDELDAMLQGSEYLLGTFASSWFRVACGLHVAKLIDASQLSLPEISRRHWPLDIEWMKEMAI